MPRPSQRTLRAPRYAPSTRSSSARVTPGFRACTRESRHSSVARRAPRPLTSMAPPSRTMRRRATTGCQHPRRSARASASPTAASRRWFRYFAQPLKRQWTRATSPPRSSVEQPLGDPAVGVDAAIAEEGPAPPDVLLPGEVALDDEHLLGAPRCLSKDDTEGIAGE